MNCPKSNVYLLDKSKKEKIDFYYDWLNKLWDSDLPPKEKLPSLAVASFMNRKKTYCYPTLRRLCKRACLKHEDNLSKNLHRVSAKGWIRIKTVRLKGKKRNYYYLDLPDEKWKDKTAMNFHRQYLQHNGALKS